MLPLPSDHPDQQGVKEVPDINPNSIKLAQKRLEKSACDGEVVPPVHHRLYS